MLLQIAVCLPFINSFPVALDEPFSIFWAQQDLGVMLNEINQGNNSPLHFILLNFWIKMFGISPVAVRSLSLLFSVLTIPVMFKFAQKLMHVEYAIICVLIFIFSRFNHYHALEARMYSLFVLECLTIGYLTYEMIFHQRFRSMWFVLIATCALYTHYLGLVLVFTIFILVLLFKRNFQTKLLYTFLLSILVLMVVFIPGLIVLYQRLSQGAGDTWVPLPHWTEYYGNIIRFFNNTFTFSAILIVTLWLFITKFYRQRGLLHQQIRNPKLGFILLLFFVPYSLMFVYSFALSPVFLDRYLLFLTPFLYLSAASIFNLLDVSRLKYIGMTLVLAFMIFSVKIIPDNNRQPDIIANYVKELRQENSVVCLIPPYYDLTFYYHYNRIDFGQMEPDKHKMSVENVYGIYSFSDIEDELLNTNQLLVVSDNAEEVLPENDLFERLEIWGEKISEREFAGGARVVEYVHK